MRQWIGNLLRKHFPSLYYTKVPANHPTLQMPGDYNPNKGVILDQKAQQELGELLKKAPLVGGTRHE